ncbi:MAG: response regulator, partial [Proteobacteria bacterium]|nr:response regulator [Pseudomonadota bacterium]
MGALKVFLVEDNPYIRAGLVRALQDVAGAQVLATAESESDAAAWLTGQKGAWDLAVIELCLRHGAGLGVIRSTSGRRESQRVAVLTDYASKVVRDWCREAGADAV